MFWQQCISFRVKRSENKKMAEIAHFLKENDLSVDTLLKCLLPSTVMTVLLPAAVIPGNIIKCVAISESVRGEGLALTLATELINLAQERHCICFIYMQSGIRSCLNSAAFRR